VSLAAEPIAAPVPLERPVAPLGNSWVGGFDLPSLGRQEAGIWLNFIEGRLRANADDLRGVPLLHALQHAEEIRFEALIDDGVHAFRGRLTAPDTLVGEVEVDGARGAFEFTRYAVGDTARFAESTAGIYNAEDGKQLFVSYDGPLRTLFDVESGQVRSLFQREDGSFRVGFGLSAIYPARGRLKFVTGSDGRAERLEWSREDGTSVIARRENPKLEELRFGSEGVTLAGTLATPPTPGPHPLLVNVHDSGRATHDWWTAQMTAFFLGEGFAVFTYHKRGTGQSGGEYVGADSQTSSTSRQNLALLAKDARAAVRAAAQNPRVDRRRVGLFGLGEAGWIMPSAASGVPGIRFLISFSAPAVPVSLGELHSLLFQDGDVDTGLDAEDVDAIVRRARRQGHDPAPLLSRLRIPALFVYGALDARTPAPESERALAKIAPGHDFEVVSFADAGHRLLSVPRDIKVEALRSSGFTAELLPTLRRWLPAHTGASPR
jgi:dienelactone hydrolase